MFSKNYSFSNKNKNVLLFTVILHSIEKYNLIQAHLY